MVNRFINWQRHRQSSHSASHPPLYIIPCIGNWDVFPTNRLGSNDSDPVSRNYLSKIYDTWSGLLHPALPPPPSTTTATNISPLYSLTPDQAERERLEIKSNFTSYGFFVKDIVPYRLSIISLNTLFWFKENEAVQDCSPWDIINDSPSSIPGDVHFRFLISVLQDRRKRKTGMGVVLMGHIPPKDFDDRILYHDNCYRNLVQMSGEYADVIISQHYGYGGESVGLKC